MQIILVAKDKRKSLIEIIIEIGNLKVTSMRKRKLRAIIEWKIYSLSQKSQRGLTNVTM